ncbi:RluA family pseudouridine synthase [Collinsella ureilytica]|nr:RluA family pseudouridine synthase [Collinsella urealyticum]
MRLDSLIGSIDGVPSRSAAARLIEEGSVFVNGSPCDSKRRLVRSDDLIELSLPQPRPEPSFVSSALEADPIPLDIRFEDEYLIVLSKPRGLVCHPARGHERNTLANALVHHVGIEHLGTLQGEDRPGIVHRLDRDTSGLMLAAKDDDTQRDLQNLIRIRTLDRRYITLVHGGVAADTGTITTGIARSLRDRQRMAVSADLRARQAITTYEVLARIDSRRGDEGYTLVECHLFTGRTHQIRVHMRHIGHSIVGDPLYGKGSQEMNLDLARQFLHSWSIRFDHPRTGEAIVLTDELPWDLAGALDALADRCAHTTPRGREIIPHLGLFDTSFLPLP